MRTNTFSPAATLFSRFLALITVCACTLPLWAATPDLETSPGNPLRGLVNVPQVAPSQEGALESLPPETRGDLLMTRQQYAAAIRAYQQCPRESAVRWNKIGIAYQHMYALDFAKLQYEKALSINPNYSEALNNLGTVYYGMKNFRKAENFYRKALHLMPDSASYYSNLGTAYFADHKMKQGIDAYRHAFEIDPGIFIRESIARIQSAAASAEEQMALNYALAKLYAQAGNFDAALRYLRMALMEGFDDRKKLMDDKEFASLRGTSEFRLLMAEEHLN
ncbi:tetratricopeptide repeat protein [Silvibacterium acidisoli]|uniref:tetratricopeptide repeat protein n=1 Tax=Acidobacteriaceae bacterium ZG23-2 TaxID=2883246 RepID=UPI00406C1FC0